MDVKKDFKIFERKVNGKSMVYLDSAATSLKPRSVVQAVDDYYEKYTANIFRGVYRLSEEATEAYEGARKKIAKFIGAKSEKEVVFVRNTTEAINLVMYSWGLRNVQKGDETGLTVMEHHSNLVPWQTLAEITEAKLKYVGLDEEGRLDMEAMERAVRKKTKLVALTHVSNVLGVVNPVKEIINRVKSQESRVKVLVDGAQAVPHMRVDVSELGCDWYVFSGHKMLGPTGIGVLWGKNELLEEMAPFMYGGEMIREVRLEGTTFAEVPHKFEAGTPHIAGAIGLGAAVDYLMTHHSVHHKGMEAVREHEQELLDYGVKKLREVKGVKIIGPPKTEDRGGVVAFTVKGVHPHDVAQVLDEDNIYIRAGHHCAMPLHKYLGVQATCRASFYVYNTKEDVDKLVEGLEKVRRKFKK
jgi:cysteine desulfurase/selenocysteine lyase